MIQTIVANFGAASGIEPVTFLLRGESDSRELTDRPGRFETKTPVDSRL